MQFDFAQQPGIKRWNADLIKTAEPLVSIITPFYNSGTTIRQTANCVFDQTFPFFEWILVDDGSTAEEDIDMLDVLANEDPRVVVLHKKNGGASSARNPERHWAPPHGRSCPVSRGNEAVRGKSRWHPRRARHASQSLFSRHCRRACRLFRHGTEGSLFLTYSIYSN